MKTESKRDRTGGRCADVGTAYQFAGEGQDLGAVILYPLDAGPS
jgi:hypothetical protein